MMPAENFGRQLLCWRQPICIKKNGKHYRGRRCCRRISKQFRAMEGELYNLWPSVGLINQVRSNFRYALLHNRGELRTHYYGCSIIIDRSARKVEPQDVAKGIVSRANLFMSKHYGIKLSKGQRRLFEAWNKKYPPKAWEKEWTSRVTQIEGYPNPYVITGYFSEEE